MGREEGKREEKGREWEGREGEKKGEGRIIVVVPSRHTQLSPPMIRHRRNGEKTGQGSRLLAVSMSIALAVFWSHHHHRQKQQQQPNHNRRALACLPLDGTCTLHACQLNGSI